MSGGSEPAEPIRVLVVDDHELYRRGLLIVLAQEPDIEVIGETGSGDGAVALAADLGPDLVLMDVRMPRSGGIAACRTIKAASPTTKIVMLTASEDEADLYEAIKAGASGYLLKESSIEEVVAAIRATHEGQALLNPTMAAKLLAEFVTMARRNEASRVPRLTVREVDVLKLLAWARTNREIADALFISEHTVKSHVANILEKLQLHSRLEAAMYAVREKLVDID
ncbi:MAG: response regulator transcription factor [Actinomycetota bacterium]|nr:response regulator transcription factor [Actinomycetota bacterium]